MSAASSGRRTPPPRQVAAGTAGRTEGELDALRSAVLSIAARHGLVSAERRAGVAACEVADRLRTLAVDLAAAADGEVADALLAALSAPVVEAR